MRVFGVWEGVRKCEEKEEKRKEEKRRKRRKGEKEKRGHDTTHVPY